MLALAKNNVQSQPNFGKAWLSTGIVKDCTLLNRPLRGGLEVAKDCEFEMLGRLSKKLPDLEFDSYKKDYRFMGRDDSFVFKASSGDAVEISLGDGNGVISIHDGDSKLTIKNDLNSGQDSNQNLFERTFLSLAKKLPDEYREGIGQICNFMAAKLNGRMKVEQLKQKQQLELQKLMEQLP